jgi:hypothetical protein
MPKAISRFDLAHVSSSLFGKFVRLNCASAYGLPAWCRRSNDETKPGNEMKGRAVLSGITCVQGSPQFLYALISLMSSFFVVWHMLWMHSLLAEAGDVLFSTHKLAIFSSEEVQSENVCLVWAESRQRLTL